MEETAEETTTGAVFCSLGFWGIWVFCFGLSFCFKSESDSVYAPWAASASASESASFFAVCFLMAGIIAQIAHNSVLFDKNEWKKYKMRFIIAKCIGKIAFPTLTINFRLL